MPSSAGKTTAKKSSAKKSAGGSQGTRRTAGRGSASQPDKSVEAFREALEKTITLPRERIQEVIDDAVDRGKLSRKDANDLVRKLVRRGRKQSEELLEEVERLLEQARAEVEGRARKARGRIGKTAGKVARQARDVADEPLAKVDELRRRAGVGPSFPITGYDELTAAQVTRRLSKLSDADLRKVRDHEAANKARKSILSKIDKRLGQQG